MRAKATLLVLALTLSAQAKPLIVQYNDFEIDWSNLKVRFTGANSPNDNADKQPYNSLKALAQGLATVMPSIKSFYEAEYDGLSPQARAKHALANDKDNSAAKRIEASTYIVKSDLFQDGSINLSLESNLTTALVGIPQTANHKRSVLLAQKAGFTGLVFLCPQNTSPSAWYQIFDPSKTQTLSLDDVKPEAFQKDLMGRFFSDLSPLERSRYSGQNPLIISLKQERPKTFVTENYAEWQALTENLNLFRESRIVFSVSSAKSKAL